MGVSGAAPNPILGRSFICFPLPHFVTVVTYQRLFLVFHEPERMEYLPNYSDLQGKKETVKLLTIGMFDELR